MSWYGKGYLRTLEVMIAFVITFGFLLLTLDEPSTSNTETSNKYLDKHITDDAFRQEIFNMQPCEYKDDNTTLTRILDIDEEFVICNEGRPDLPKKTVFAESAYMTGNITTLLAEPVVRLYYWN